MAPPEVVNLAEFLPSLLERLQGEAQRYFVQIAWMWHWLQLYLNETSEGEPAGRPVLADGVAGLLGSEQTRVPVNVWDALDEHLTLTLESPAWRKSDLLRMHECLTARGLVLDPERCHPEGNVAHAPEAGRFYWAYQWPEQALWLELELVDPPTKVNFRILGAALLTSPWVTGYTTAESLAAFYKHFEALKECGEWDC